METKELVENNMGIAYSIAQKLFYGNRRIIEYDDLVEICLLALVEASKKFKDNHGAKFSTYAYIVINNKAIDELNKIRNRTCLNIPYDENGLENIEENNIDKEIDNIECDICILNQIKNLKYYKKYEFIILDIINGYEAKEIAIKYNILERKVWYIRSRLQKDLDNNLHNTY